MGQLSQEFAEASVTATANALLSQEFAEPAVTVNAQARLTQLFLEVAVVAGGTVAYGVWPLEGLSRMVNVQGQRLRRTSGQR